MSELPLILQLDVAGNPRKWIDYEKAAYYYTKGRIAWTMNAQGVTLHGGISRMTGEQSRLEMDTIIAVRSDSKINSRQLQQINHVPLTNKALFRRDKNVCAYCGHQFAHYDLSRDHIIPTSRGGPNKWTNVVTACHHCNKHKDARTPEEAGMELIYLPYAPNRAEYLILMNRKILADQMDFLLKLVSKDSRLL